MHGVAGAMTNPPIPITLRKSGRVSAYCLGREIHAKDLPLYLANLAAMAMHSLHASRPTTAANAGAVERVDLVSLLTQEVRVP